MVLGLKYGDHDPKDHAAKTVHYKHIQAFAKRFEAHNGSMICREMLGLQKGDTPAPQPRTSEYYKKRPCPKIVEHTADLLAEYLEEMKQQEA